jgi:hypothetical protein
MKRIIFFSIAILYFVPSTISPQSSFGNAVDFDGDGDYANTFNNPYFPTINGTIEAWVKVRSISLPGGNQGEAFVSKNEEQWNNGDFYVFFDYSNGRLKSRVQKPPSIEVDVISNNNFWQNLNTWFHYAFTWGAGGMRMYINGVLQNSQNNFNYSALNNDYNFYVGAHGYRLHSGQYVVADFFDGQMDELRIWNYQKSSQQINALKDAPLDAAYYNTIDSGLVGYWRFDVLEDLGINNDGPDDIRDFSVLHNHLDLAGDAHLVPYNTVTTNVFEKTFGGTGSERGIGIDITSDGGMVIAGSTLSFTNDEAMYVIKLDSSANLQWSKTYFGFGYSKLSGVKQTSDGGYYLTGFTEGGFGFLDQVMIKIDMNGNVVWAKNNGGVQADELRKLSITSDGGLITAGYNASIGAGAKDVQALKLTSSGNIEWAKTYGTMYEDFCSSCIIASDGSYVLSGAVDITGTYGIRPTLIKLDTLGNIIWSKYYSGYIEDWARDLIETPDGGFLITGETRSYGLGGSQDIYLIKTNSSGNVEWAKSYGGIGNDVAYALVQSSDGKYVVAGYTSSFGFGGYDGFLMKVNADGSLEWFHTYGGYTSDYIYDLIETPDLGFALTGRRSSNTLGGDDLYLIKTDADGYSNCAFGTFNPNVFIISNLLSINLNMATQNFISSSNLNLTTLTPNSAQTTSCGIIPVELKFFNYEIENNKVILHWTTATEINNLGFEIERCNSDKEWTTIGFTEGKGTTTEIQDYTYLDDLFGINSEKVFYRLKQIDFNGQFNYSPEIEVELQIQPDEFNLYQNYPNPFNPVTVIKYSIPKLDHVALIIYDSLGRQILKIVDEVKEPGYYEAEFDAAKLPSGIYFYSLYSGEYYAAKKMALIK